MKFIKTFNNYNEYELYKKENIIMPSLIYCKNDNLSSIIKEEKRIVIIFNITDINISITIMENYNNFSNIEIDGVLQNGLNTTYKFNTLGKHIIKYELIDNTIIFSRSFAHCDNIINVSLPNSIITIGAAAFISCKNLKTIKLSNKLKYIEDSAFSHCFNLENIILPNNLERLNYECFYKCKALNNIIIPKNVKIIEQRVFSNCGSLTSIIVHKDNKIYDSRNNCNAIIETSTNTLISGCLNTIIPNTVDIIGDYSFYQCSNLLNIIIPSNIKIIGTESFWECYMLTNIIIPSNIITIDDGAFGYCSNYNLNIIIEEGVKNIKERSFTHTGIKNIIIPNSIKIIELYVFSGSDIKNIILSNQITSINNYAFYNCKSLISVTINALIPPTLGNYVFDNNANGRKIYVPQESLEIYKETDGWLNYINDIEPITNA